MNIEFVFLDIDGTLVKNGHLVSSAERAVAKLLERGIGVALCTGRSVLHTRSLQRRLHISYGVYFNGGLVMHDHEVLAKSPLAHDTVTRALHFFHDHDLPFLLHTEAQTFTTRAIPRRLEPILQAYNFEPAETVPAEHLLQSTLDVYQANVFMTADWEARVQQTFPECLIYRWDAEAVDLQRRSSDKSIGAMALLNYLGIAPDCAVHFGDGGNDIGMFQTMGTSVAMGNAEPHVKKHAQFQTTAVDDDGVLLGLQRLGLF